MIYIVSILAWNTRYGNRAIDHHAPDWLLSGLSKFSGLSVERLNQMCLRSYEGLVFESLSEVSVTREMLALAVYHRKRKIFDQQNQRF